VLEVEFVSCVKCMGLSWCAGYSVGYGGRD